jgi:mono/diheme cytochrome c family protein
MTHDRVATASAPAANSAAPIFRGLLAEFDSPDALKTAARRVRDAGYTRWDTHTPFPIHGIEECMAMPRTRLPYIVLACGVAGCLLGLGLVWWTNATGALSLEFIRQYVPNFISGYPFLVSGKPDFSLPANIPPIFELTVLLAAFGAVLGMLVLNDLPKFYQPLFHSARFRRVTSDRFFVRVDANDPNFHLARTRAFLESLGAHAVEDVVERPQPALRKGPLVQISILAACALLIPPSIVAWARFAKKAEPRFHIVQDMDNQEKFKAQHAMPLFADGRAMRQPVAGTVALGETRLDEHFYRGLVKGDYALDFPTHRPEVRLDEAFIRRGQRQFSIYCAPCHGLDGSGEGRVNQRALELTDSAWVQAAALYDGERTGRTAGHIFNTITNGVRTMPSYGDRLSETDRWAIVAYVRALQWSHNAHLGDLPEPQQAELLQRGARE